MLHAPQYRVNNPTQPYTPPHQSTKAMADPVTEPHFPCFPNLPKEIKLMIWKKALPGPRIVSTRQKRLNKTIGEWEDENQEEWPNRYLGTEILAYSANPLDIYRSQARAEVLEQLEIDENEENMHRYKEGYMLGYVTDCPAPEITYVCREAFGVVSKHYVRILQAVDACAGTWFDFDVDTLYWGPGAFSCRSDGNLDTIVDALRLGFMPLDIVSLTQNINRLAIEPGFETYSEIESLLELLRKFTHLEKLTFIHGHVEGPVAAATTPIAFIDSINVADLLSQYESKYKDRHQWEAGPVDLGTLLSRYQITYLELHGFAKPIQPNIGTFSDQIPKTPSIDRVQGMLTFCGIPPPPVMPVFEDKITISAATFDALELWRAFDTKKCQEFNVLYREYLRERYGENEDDWPPIPCPFPPIVSSSDWGDSGEFWDEDCDRNNDKYLEGWE